MGLARTAGWAPVFGIVIFLVAGAPAAQAGEAAEKTDGTSLVASICKLISMESEKHALPPEFLARLLWKESRFNPSAVSPKGAEGVAQFMPGTALMRGLDDAFDIQKAIPASAAYLADLKRKFGNLGLAAAAYNAGEARVARWLSKGGFLPLETENYVMAILGAPVDVFSERGRIAEISPLDPRKPFDTACLELPVSARSVAAMSGHLREPWGVQLAGHFRRDVAIRLWQKVLRRHRDLLNEYEPAIARVRSARGRRGIYAVRVGAASRAEALATCRRFRRSGLPCIVLSNR